jgi:hypothetical protein
VLEGFFFGGDAGELDAGCELLAPTVEICTPWRLLSSSFVQTFLADCAEFVWVLVAGADA